MTAATASLVERASSAFTAYREGDDARLAELIHLVTPVLWHVARGCGLDAATAEDVVQNTWVKLYERTSAIDQPGAILAWLVTTARRDAWRLSQRQTRTTPADLGGTDRLPGDPVGTPVPVDPTAEVLRDERDRVLWAHIQRLSPRCQALVRVICFAETPNYAQLSESLGMPVGSIGPTRGRCLATLRKALLEDPTWSTHEH
jgi:RNA polymerase sigma factor (sigma-70 family)